MIPTDTDVSAIDKLYHSGAWLCLGIVAVFLVLRYAATHWAWLKEDHRAVWVSAILGGLAILIVPATQGTTPNLSMILTASFTVLALHADPKKTPAEQDKASAQGGFTRLSVMIAIALLGGFLLAGCSSSARLKTLNATMAGLDAVQIGYGAWEKQREFDIAHDPAIKSHAEGDAALATFQAKRDKASADLKKAYELLKAAFQLDDDPSLTTALAAAALVKADLAALGVLP
jgi:hypothetical protein